LLSDHGHRVICFRRHNDELKNLSVGAKVVSGLRTVWTSDSYQSLTKLLHREKPDLAHFHNTFPLISPSAYYACRAAGVHVLQTLHNYRILCPAASLTRKERVCESCLGRAVAWPGIVRGCYRGSYGASASVAAMASVHRALGTWSGKVDLYVALSEFARGKFVEGGLPAVKIVVKPNFVRGECFRDDRPGGYGLFVGRLSEEKG